MAGSVQSINLHCAECGLEFATHGQFMTARGGRICRDAAACTERQAAAPHAIGCCATCGGQFRRVSDYTYVLEEKVCRDNEDCAEQSLLRQRARCEACGGGVR